MKRRSSGAEVPLDHGLGPHPEQVPVGGVVHHVDGAGARGTGADLAEDHLAVVLAVPLHVGESGPETQRAEHIAPHRLPAGQPVDQSMSRSTTVCGLIHSWLRACSGRGRYQLMFSYRIVPAPQTVS